MFFKSSKKYTRHALLGVCSLVALSVTAPEAHAQRGIMLDPAAGWAVNRVSTEESGGSKPYCALARRFDKNIILTVAQNMGGESSLAFDFQAPRFDKQRYIGITLDAGAGEQRSYETKPVSSGAFVLRLGHDETFFTALERTGHLRLEVNNRSYHFNLTDYVRGQNRLNSCLSSLARPAIGGDEADPLPASKVPSVEMAQAPQAPAVAASASEDLPPAGDAYRMEMNKLQRTLQKLESDNVRLTEMLATRQKDTLDKLNAKHAQKRRVLETQIAALREDNARLKAQTVASDTDTAVLAQLETLQSENRALKTSLAQAGSNAAAVAAGAAPDIRLTALEGTIETLKKELATKEEALLKAARQAVEFEALQTENTKLKEQITLVADQTTAVGALEEKLAALEKENQALRTKVAVVRDYNVESQFLSEEKIVALEAQNEELRAEVQSLRATNLRLATLDRNRDGEDRIDEIMGELGVTNTSAPVAAVETAAAEVPATPKSAAERLEAHMAAAEAEIARRELENLREAAVTQTPALPPAALPIRRLLERATLDVGESFKAVRLKTSGAAKAYQWKIADIFGVAEQRPLPNETDETFEQEVIAYISKTEERCPVDFAVIPVDTQQIGALRVDAYEIACVGVEIDSAAALLFIKQEGYFTALAHESRSTLMASAMALRDRVLEALEGAEI